MAAVRGLERASGGLPFGRRKEAAAAGVEVVSAGLVEAVDKAFEAGHRLRAADVDLKILHVTTYALSSTVLPVVQRAGVTVVIVNIQPSSRIDYENFNKVGDRTKMTGEWLAHCAACPVPEIANVFNRARISFFQVTGVLEGDDHLSGEIDE